jgi:hypothetical protein
MANYLVCDPYRTLMYERGDSRPKVTLARVPGAEEGDTYTTVPFTLTDTARGDHMRERVKARRWV